MAKYSLHDRKGTEYTEVSDSAPLPVTATFSGGDIEIGAVEIKNSTDDTRATVGANGLSVSVSPSQGSFTDKSGTITLGGTSQTLAAANSSRKYLFVQNVSSDTLWINFGVAAVQTQPSLKIIPDGSFVMEGNFISTQAVNIIGPNTSAAFTSKEG